MQARCRFWCPHHQKVCFVANKSRLRAAGPLNHLQLGTLYRTSHIIYSTKGFKETWDEVMGVERAAKGAHFPHYTDLLTKYELMKTNSFE